METLVRWLLSLKGEAIASDAEWSTRFLGAPPLWVSLLVVVPLLAGFVFVIYRRESRTAPPAARMAMAALRFLALLLVVLMLYDPIVSIERTLTRRATVAPVEVAHRSTTIGLLSGIAVLLRRKLRWDPVRETFPQDEEANRMLARALRSPWRT